MKKTILRNYKVKIEVNLGYMGEDIVELQKGNPLVVYDARSKQLAEEALEQVRRHVDLYDKSYASVEPTRDEICEHCGNKWSERSNEYNGGCCAKDEVNNPNPEAT